MTEAYQQKLKQGYLRDFIFDTEKLSRDLKLNPSDFTNYSTIELKANLLLALQAHYNNYIADGALNHEKDLAQWMITQRKGLFCIELNVLLLSAHFTIYKKQYNETQEAIYLKCDTNFTYNAFMALTTGKILDPSHIANLSFTEEIQPSKVLTEGTFKSIDNTTYQLQVVANWGASYSMSIDHTSYRNDVVFVFPDFISSINNVNFKQRLHSLLDNELPIHTSYASFFVDKVTLEWFIKAYTAWHNSMIYNADKSEKALQTYLSYNSESYTNTWLLGMANTVEAQTSCSATATKNAGELYNLIEGLTQNSTDD